jgi:hypothetical protein
VETGESAVSSAKTIGASHQDSRDSRVVALPRE